MKLSVTACKRAVTVMGIAMMVPLFANADSMGGKETPRCEKAGHMEKQGGHHRGHHEFMPGGEDAMPHFIHRLNLDEAQQDVVFKIVHEQAPAMREKRKALHQAQKALREMTMSPQYDDAKAKKLAESIADQTGMIALLKAQNFNRIYALLTNEQQEQLKQMKADGEFKRVRGEGGHHRKFFRPV